MSLSCGYFSLRNVDNAFRIAKRLINHRLCMPDEPGISYVFREVGACKQAAQDEGIPIFVMSDDAADCDPNAILIPNTAVLSFDTVTSTQSVLEAMVKDEAFEKLDLLVTSRQQLQGRGRRGRRVWTSPLGCAMFSFSHRLSASSLMGQRLGFLQHLISLSIVKSVPLIPSLKIKWPNDVYYGASKVAGVIINCHMTSQDIVALAGVGINVNNDTPSVCLNSILKSDLSSEERIEEGRLICDVVTHFKQSVQKLESEEALAKATADYTDRWMHSGQEMLHKGQKFVISGVDEQGFLVAAPSDGGPKVTMGFDFEDVNLVAA